LKDEEKSTQLRLTVITHNSSEQLQRPAQSNPKSTPSPNPKPKPQIQGQRGKSKNFFADLREALQQRNVRLPSHSTNNTTQQGDN
jgi:hypothetical protein